MLEVVQACLAHLLESKNENAVMKQMIPTLDEDLTLSSAVDRFRQVTHDTDQAIELGEGGTARARADREYSIEGLES